MDEKRLGNLWQHVYAECYRCSLRYRLNTVEADICAVEFAEEILLFLDRTRQNSLLSPENQGLLYRRAVWFVLDWRKRGGSGRLSEVPLSDLDSIAYPPSSDALDPFAQTHHAYVRKVLCRAVDSLPRKQRQCAFRYWFLQETDTEIALALALTPPAVRKNRQRAREKRLEILKQMGFEAEDLPRSRLDQTLLSLGEVF